MEEGYQQLTTALEFRFDKIFSDKADLIATFYTEKNVKDNSLIGTERYIYFRSDGFVDAGSRFSNMPERVPMSAKEYIKAFEQGVRNSFATPISDKELKKIREEETVKKEEIVNEFIKTANALPVEEGVKLETVEDYRNLITAKLAELDSEVKKQKKAELKDKGIPFAYTTQEDIEVLKKFLKVILSE